MNRLFTLLLVAVAFTACKKEEKTITPTPVDKPISYLNRVTYFSPQLGQELLQDTIALDAQGSLAFAAHVGKNRQHQGFTNIYTKDGFGRIVKAEGYSEPTDVIDGILSTIYSFTYNDKGNIDKAVLVQTGITRLISTYTYDEYNRLVSERREAMYPEAAITTREYTYSNPGTLNPASMKETMNDDATTTTEYLYTYDSNPTPYSTLPKILYYMGIGPLSVNNVVNVSVRDENNTTTNIYRYNGEGLPFVKQSNKDTEYKYYYGTL